MKNTVKSYLRIAGIIALTAVIGFAMAACDTDNNGSTDPDLSGDITIYPIDNVYTETELTAKYDGLEAVSYHWKNGTNSVGTNSNKFTPTEPGSYTVTVSAAGYKPKSSAAVTVSERWILFNSITELSNWLSTQPRNDLDSIYYVKLNAAGLGGKSSTSGSVGYALSGADQKLVRLNLSGSTFTSVEMSAFENCSHLVGITLPNTVTKIDKEAFNGCSSLLNITIPNSVISIEENAFKSCDNLSSVTLGNNIQSIDHYAFEYCKKLENITIPATVTYLSPSAFAGCSGLTEINVDSSNSKYSSQDGVLFNKDKTSLIKCPEGKTGAFSIPTSVNDIGDAAFYACSKLTSVFIPNSVGRIQNWAFAECSSLTAITISNSVYNIFDYTFYKCAGLTSITIPNNVDYIGEKAFAFCTKLTSVNFQASIEEKFFEENAFGEKDEDDYIGDLREKYLTGKEGTYTRENSNSVTWSKQL